MDKPYLPPIFEIILDNMKKSANPLGLTSQQLSDWSKGSMIPTESDVILYACNEYQMMPYMQRTLDILKRIKFADTVQSAFRNIQGALSRFGLDPQKAFMNTLADRIDHYHKLMETATLVLNRLKIDFAYWPDELYSGAMLYELGLMEEFQQHALKVVNQLKERGGNNKTLVAMSPHAADMITNVYPLFFDGFHVRCLTYTEFICEKLAESKHRLSIEDPITITIHDPCRLARPIDLTGLSRKVLTSVEGIEILETTNRGPYTTCCSAPCEVVYPELSELLATHRTEELIETGARYAVTFCPFCYARFTSRLDSSERQMKTVDFIEVIWSALKD